MGKIILFIALFCGAIYAHKCATDHYMEALIREDPDMLVRIEKDELAIREKLSLTKRRDANTVYTIPAVVHIIYNQNVAAQNPTNQQVIDQIARINKDYRRTNADASDTLTEFQSLAADSKIQFVLASVDPLGNPTNGITRTQTAVTQFDGPPTNGGSAPDLMKATATGGEDPWPRDQYVNIWVCKITPSGGGSQTLGYANYQSSAALDGLVIHTPAFGYQSDFYGRTLTHEMGHWLNLKHPWGSASGGVCGDDFVTDTPQKTGPSYQCQLDTTQCSAKSMVQNYMDYSDDLCMNVFTAGQAARMRAVLEPGGFRDTIAYTNYTGTVPGVNDGSSDPLATATTGGVDLGGLQSDLPSELNDIISKLGLPLWAIILLAVVGLILILACIGVCLRCLCRD